MKAENPEFLTSQLITYIGNKRALLNNINERIVSVKSALGKEKISCFDGFSGSGSVARLFKQHASKIIVNDLEGYTVPINRCFLSNQGSIAPEVWNEIYSDLKKDLEPGFISELYSPKDDTDIQEGERCFYTNRNALFIDGIRKNLNKVDDEFVPFFLAPLLYCASVHVNTSGVFKGFYKNREGIGQFGGEAQNALSRIKKDIELSCPVFSNFHTDEVAIFNDDVKNVVSEMDEVDLAYFDPPYNQHPYGSNYFMLNLIAGYERPSDISKVSGIPSDWTRSVYNRREEASDEFFSLIKKCPSKFILISFNSEGFIPFNQFNQKLKRLGKVQTFSTEYNVFKGSRNLKDRNIKLTEYLFLVEKF